MFKQLFLLSITDPVRIISTMLSFIIPFTIYHVNKKLHQHGDPPWKKDH